MWDMFRSCLTGLIATSLLALGCASEEVPAQQDAAATETGPALYEAPPVVRCWAEKDPDDDDDFFRADSVYCERGDMSGFPLKTHGTLNLKTADDNYDGALLDDLPVGEPTLITKIRVEDYPVEVKLDLRFDPASDVRIAGWSNAQTMTHVAVLDAPAADVNEVPWLHFPFDIWKVDITALTAEVQDASLAPHAVDVAPYVTSSDASLVQVERGGLGLYLPIGHSGSALVAAGRGAPSLPATATVAGEEITFDFTGAGTYLAEPGQIRKQGEEDLARRNEGPVYARCWVREEVRPLEPADPEQPDATETVYRPECQALPVDHLTAAATQVRLGDATVELSTAAVAFEALGADAFPLTFELATDATSDAVGFRDELAASPLATTLVLDEPVTDITVEAKLPIAFLSAEVVAEPTTLFGGEVDPYVVVFGEPWAGLASLGVRGAQFPDLAGSGTLTFVVAPGQTTVTGKAYVFDGAEVHDEVPVTIADGATYRVTAEGLVPEG